MLTLLKKTLATFTERETDSLAFEVYDANNGVKYHVVDIYNDAEGFYLDIERVD